MADLVRNGCGKMEFAQRYSVDDTLLDAEESVLYGQMAGRKFETTKEFYSTRDTAFDTALASVADESNRFATQNHLHYAYRPYSYAADQPTILHIYINPHRSFLYDGALNDVALVRGRSPRLVLLWRTRGCTSMREWMQKFGGDCWKTWRATMSSHGGQDRRERKKLKKYTIYLCSDPDITDADARSLATSFVQKTRDQLGDGAHAQYWENIHNTPIPSGVVLDACQLVQFRVDLIMAQRFVVAKGLSGCRMVVAECENEHAKNRRAAEAKNQSVSVVRLGAKATIRQLHEKGLADEQRFLPISTDATPLPTSKRAAFSIEDRAKTYKRNTFPEECHRIDWCNEVLAENSHFNVISARARALCLKDWEQLDDERRALYELQANATNNLRCKGLVEYPLPIQLGDAPTETKAPTLLHRYRHMPPTPTPPPKKKGRRRKSWHAFGGFCDLDAIAFTFQILHV